MALYLKEKFIVSSITLVMNTAKGKKECENKHIDDQGLYEGL
jgi:hypothetical protein